jgi:hypothetical protein
MVPGCLKIMPMCRVHVAAMARWYWLRSITVILQRKVSMRIPVATASGSDRFTMVTWKGKDDPKVAKASGTT